MNYDESIEWLYGTQTFGIKLGLENVQRMLAEFGVNEAMEGRKVIHVAGTNGKGSVCAFAEQVLRDAGFVTGLFTSPHLVTFRERIRICGEEAAEETIAKYLTEIRSIVESWDPHPTFFEIVLILGLQIFCESDCEVILLETGMGGKLDATNAIQANVSVITSISLDHQQWLGETLREIAGEKAGILKPNTPVVVADLDPVARDVVGRRALSLGIPYIEFHPLPEDWKLGLAGEHQRENAALAVEAACRVDDGRLTRDGIRESLEKTSWPGRFQRLGNRLIVDGAHNLRAAEVLCDTWQKEFPGEKADLIFGAVQTKDVSGIFQTLLPILSSITFVPVKSERRLSEEEMKVALAKAGGEGIPIFSASDLSEALANAEKGEGKTLVAGSLFLVGEVLSHFQDEGFEVSLQ